MKTMTRKNVICSAVLFAAFASLAACGQNDQSQTTPVGHTGQMRAMTTHKCTMTGALTDEQKQQGQQPTSSVSIRTSGDVDGNCQTQTATTTASSPIDPIPTDSTNTSGTTATSTDTAAASSATATVKKPVSPTASAAPTTEACPKFSDAAPEGFKEITLAELVAEKKQGKFQLAKVEFSVVQNNNKTQKSSGLSGTIDGLIDDALINKPALAQMNQFTSKCNDIEVTNASKIDDVTIRLPNTINALDAKATYVRFETITPLANHDLKRLPRLLDPTKGRAGATSFIAAATTDVPKGLVTNFYSNGTGQIKIIGHYVDAKGDLASDVVYIGTYSLK